MISDSPTAITAQVVSGQLGSIRAIFGATTLPDAQPPYDRVQFRVYYPAHKPRGAELNTGSVGVDPQQTPLPVVIIAAGVNCGPEAYQWLAHELAANGFAVVTYSCIVALGPDLVGLIPDDGSSGPTSRGTVFSALLAGLADVNRRPPLAGALDLSRVALIGHSAGGRTALYLAAAPPSPLAAVVALSAHVAELGADGGPQVRPFAATCPVLMCDGDADGVISGSRFRYGVPPEAEWDPAALTFDALAPRDGEHLFVRVLGGTHFTFVHPGDPATGRAFLEAPDEDAEAHRAATASVVVAFLRRHCVGATPSPQTLDELSRATGNPGLATRAR